MNINLLSIALGLLSFADRNYSFLCKLNGVTKNECEWVTSVESVLMVFGLFSVFYLWDEHGYKKKTFALFRKIKERHITVNDMQHIINSSIVIPEYLSELLRTDINDPYCLLAYLECNKLYPHDTKRPAYLDKTILMVLDTQWVEPKMYYRLGELCDIHGYKYAAEKCYQFGVEVNDENSILKIALVMKDYTYESYIKSIKLLEKIEKQSMYYAYAQYTIGCHYIELIDIANSTKENTSEIINYVKAGTDHFYRALRAYGSDKTSAHLCYENIEYLKKYEQDLLQNVLRIGQHI